ncbi:hypothetical protein V1264_025018 [Littorina saxatilis]|uniref:Uncharacterized protein n=3 Tax=Littorina saxatilis TaxID=31220 RepID=A0AAN9AMY1_9CAEN
MESKIPQTSATGKEDPHQRHCKDHKIVRGQKGMMVFSLLPEIDESSDNFFLYLAQEGDSRDILRCHKNNRTSPQECEVNNSSFQFEGIVHNKLTVSIPNITLDFSGTYVLHVFVNETQGRPKTCTLTVVQELKSRKKGTISTITIVATVLGVVSIIVIVAAIIICWYTRKRNSERKNNKQTTGDEDETETPLTNVEQSDEGPSDVLLRKHSSQTSNNRE